jgi:hypothetical protein
MARNLFFLSCLVVGCGGAQPASAPTAPRGANEARIPAPAPVTNEPPSPLSACEAACERYSCAGAPVKVAEGCKTGQCGELSKRGDSALRSFAACMQRLECHDIDRSIAMNEGPAGYCFTSAR